MSASLVGSEMCIRDRPPPLPGLATQSPEKSGWELLGAPESSGDLREAPGSSGELWRASESSRKLWGALG
eukprot:14613907-Alexandrium_andersonii.AAC.1